VAQRALKLLAYIAHRQPALGASIDISEWRYIDKLLPAIDRQQTNKMPGSLAQKLQPLVRLLSATWSIDGRELRFLLEGYLQHEEQLIEISEVEGKAAVTITAKGWQRLETAPQGESSIGFVAMWFDAAMSPVWEQALYPGIYDAGYTPLRIDKKEHLNRIDDEILASIRSAKFVVADFTGHRGGVYYEAGFAGGLGKPVIWTVKREDLHGAHFDTRQYNHIAWTMDDLSAFRAALKNRIEATLGRGPIAPD